MMDTRTRKVAQLRWVADLTIDAARLQRDRLIAGSPKPRHDLDFYLHAIHRLREIANSASRLRPPVEGAVALLDDFDARFPHVQRLRDWWNHPLKEMPWTAWFSDSVSHMGDRGQAIEVISATDSHDAVETYYENLCDALGPLPAVDG
jgi:hypothetical protein